MADDLTEFVVIMSAEAVDQLREIVLYIRKDDAEAADALNEHILAAVASLGRLPERYRRHTTSRQGHAIHAMSLPPHIVYYRVDVVAAVVLVIMIRHGARRHPKRF